jgi:hypothetical protein
MMKFWWGWLLWKLNVAKNYRLAQEADKDRVYGALKEFTKNPMFWKSSRVGREYCHLTDQGREVIADMIQDMLRTVDVLERKAVDQRAQEITFESLTDSYEN